jgi:CPA2 family monovalent cation:H+ antiporter-2
MSVAQIGEFSFIIAGVGVSTGAIDPLLYSMAIAVSGITTLLTPWLIRAAPATAAYIDRKLPRSMQTFAALYSSWIEQLSSGANQGEVAPVRRASRWLFVDAVLTAAILIGASLEMDRVSSWAAGRLDWSDRSTRIAVIIGAFLLSAPLWIGMIRVARYLGFELAARVFPSTLNGQLDLAAAPRRLLVVTLQLAIVLAVGLPLVAVTQPFLPPFRGAAVLLIVILVLSFSFWRSAANLQGHTRAGAQALAGALARQMRSRDSGDPEPSLDEANRILSGLGSPTPIEIRANNPHAGRSLAEIGLRGRTGATVLAIQRGDHSVVVPSGADRLQEGDVLVIGGTKAAISAARNLLLPSNAGKYLG